MASCRGGSVDWAKSRLGMKWSMTSTAHLEGRVIRAKDWAATPDGLKVLVALRAPWFSLNLGERLIDSRKFHRLSLWAAADQPGSLEVACGTPGATRSWLRSPPKIGTEWRRVEVDLAAAPWTGGAPQAPRWGGDEGLANQLMFRLAVPLGENVSVRLKDISLLGEGRADNDPPRIEPLPDDGNCMRFRVTDPAGVRAASLLLAAGGLVFDTRSRAVSWDGEVLTWDGRHVFDERLTVYVEAQDREGNRGGLELRRGNPRLRPGGKPRAKVGFAAQRRSKQVTLTRGRKLMYGVKVGGRAAPVNRSIEIHGEVDDPKLLIDGGVDFETPQTIARSILKPGMSDREKAYAIWRWEMATASSLGLANPIDRTKYCNVFGYGYCTSHAQTVQALCEAADLPWMFLKYQYPGGHGTTQFLWEGGWHMLDSHQRIYAVTSDGRRIASAEEIEGDPEVLCPGRGDIDNYREDQRFPQMYYRPVDINPIHYTAVYKSILGGSMSQSLRRDERLIRTWQGHGRWAHSPLQPLDYANGWLVFRPQWTDEALAQEAEQHRNVRCLAGGAGLRPARPGVASVTYRLASAYLMVGGRVDLAARNTSSKNSLRLAVSADGGATWHTVWQSRGRGVVCAQADFARFLSKRWVEADSPIFRDVYDCLLRVEVTQHAGEIELTDLVATVDLQLHPVSLPALRTGSNRMTFSCRARKGPVVITHTWDEAVALQASNPEPSAGERVTLSARVTNHESRAVGPVSVRFYDGHPDIDGKPIGGPVRIRSLPAGRTVTATRHWTAVCRMHRPLQRPYKGYIHTNIFAVVQHAGGAGGGGLGSLAHLQIAVKDRPKLEIEPAFINWEPKKPRPGQAVRIFAVIWNGSSRRRPYGDGFVYVNGTPLEEVRVKLFAALPGKKRRLLGERVIRHVEPLEHGLAEVRWRIPAGARRVNVYAEATCVDKGTGRVQTVRTRKVMRVDAGR